MLKGLIVTITTTILCVSLLYGQERDTTVRLHEVHIKGQQNPISSTSISSSLSGKKLEETKGGSLATVLKEVAGVSMLKSGSTVSKPVIHGLHSNRILILNNGIRLEGQQWGSEHAPEIDPLIAERIHVIKGAESVRYGAEAIGGVVLVDPPALPVSNVLQGNADLIGASNGRSGTASGMLSGGLASLPGFGWRLQGTLKRAGNMRTAEYIMGNTGVREYNFSAALGYSAANSMYELYYSRFSTDLGILYAAHASTVADIEGRIAAGRPQQLYDFTYDISAPRQEIGHDLLKVKAHYDLSKTHTLDLTYGFQRNARQEFDFRRGNREALPITDLVLNTHSFDAVLETKSAGSGSRRILGFNGLAQVNTNIPGTLANTFIPNYDSFTGGLFAIQRLVKPGYELEAGLRYDYKRFDAAGFRYTYGGPDGEVEEEYYGGLSQFHNVTGSVGALWKISNSWHLGSNAGLAWRAPTANELFSAGLHHGAGIYEIGDADIQSEQGYKWVTGIRHFSGKLNFNLDLYAQYIRNYIYSRPDGSFRQTVSGTYPIFRYGQTNATFVGADLSGTYQFFPQLSYQLNASLVNARDQSNDSYLPYIPSGRLTQSLRFEPATGRLQEPYIEIGHTFVDRQRRYELGSDFAAPPAAYHLFEASAGSVFKLGAQELGIHLSAENLFNTLYKDYMNRYRYYTHDMGRNITLRIGYKF
ncbi:TonB-dependent receptor [Pedobacter faecalis]|uniref:TonB-dependent receptor n=1 Tax=Pedobacter faecalis TaxID=3041495 RepID=UPI00254D963E|nr:TonB-dependent receptor [Pedobacter sp. ELA7]